MSRPGSWAPFCSFSCCFWTADIPTVGTINIQADEWSSPWQITHFAKCQKTQHNMLLQVSTPTALSATKWSKKCNNLVPPTSTTIDPCSQPSHVKTILKIDVSRIHKIISLGTQMDNRYISMSRACCL
jgi:hypothetical protein